MSSLQGDRVCGWMVADRICALVAGCLKVWMFGWQV